MFNNLLEDSMYIKRTFLFLLIIITMGVGNANAKPAPEGFADIVEKLTPAVVNISTSKTFKARKGGGFEFPKGHPFEQFNDLFKQFGNPNLGKKGRKATSLGSGFVIDKEGHIVTNNHVIDGADEITVSFGDESKYEAKIIGKDPKTDLALLKIEGDKPFPFVKFGDSNKSRIGDWIIVVGNPFGLGGTVTTGIISARARDIHSGPFDDYIQTDASINRGNSGGPMFNMDGEVIGISTAIFSPNGAGNVGIGFGVPSSMASNIISQLKNSGKIVRGWLGVRIQHVTDDIAEGLELKEAKGALVAEIMEDSPAEKAGIKVGDLILKFDGKEVSVMKKLPRIVADTVVGKKVNVVVLRDGKEKNVSVIVEKLNEDDESSNDSKDGDNEDAGNKLLGMYLKQLNDSLREKYNIEESVKGLIIVDIDRDSEAAERGLRVGDVILEIGKEKAKSVSKAKDAVKKAKENNRSAILMLLSRAGEKLFQALPIEDEEEKD